MTPVYGKVGSKVRNKGVFYVKHYLGVWVLAHFRTANSLREMRKRKAKATADSLKGSRQKTWVTAKFASLYFG
jgi:hypothetical protein